MSQTATISGTPAVSVPGVSTPVEGAGVPLISAGTASASGAVGGPLPEPMGVQGQTLSYAALMESMMALMPELSNEESSIKLVEVTTLMKQLTEASEKDRIKTDQEKKRTAIGEKTAKLEEARDKLEESRRMRESGSLWDKIKLAFLAIAAIFMAIVGVFMALTPGLQAMGFMMITAAVMSIISVVDSGVKYATGLGIAGNLAKATNPDNPTAWSNADLGFSIGVAAVGLMVAGGMFFAQAPSLSLAMAQSATTLAMGVSTVVNGGVTVATALGDIAAGANRYVASTIEADAKNLEAKGKQMQALMSQLDDIIDLALARLKMVADASAAMLDSITDGLQDTSNSVSRAKFTA